MYNNSPNYSIGDIIKLNEDEKAMKKILYICETFYDESGLSKDIYYCIRSITDDNYPPSYINKTSIDKYYTKL